MLKRLLSWWARRHGRMPLPVAGTVRPAAGRTAGANIHRRVRIALYAVLVVLGGNTLLQVRQAHRNEQVRLADSAITELVAVQRMFSQRIGRLAVAAGAVGRSDAQAELAEALERSHQQAQRLHELMHRQNWLPRAPDDRLQSAWWAWWEQRRRLSEGGRQLLDALGRAGDIDPGAARMLVDRVHADAESALAAVQALLDTLRVEVGKRHADAVAQTQAWALLNFALLTVLALLAVEPAVRAVKRQYRSLAAQSAELRRLAVVAECTTNIVVITDARRCIVWVNDAFTRVTGYAAHEAIGRTPQALLASETADARDGHGLQAAAERGVALRTQVLNRTKDGRDLWLDLDMQPLYDEAGTLQGIVGVAADITELKQAQADLRLAAIAFDSLDGIVITNPDQVILRVNPAFTRITGYTAEEAIGQRPGQLLRSGRHDRSFYLVIWKQLQRQRHWQGEVWNRRKDGEIYPQWMTITAVCDEHGRAANYVAVFTDITEKKQADATIHSLAFYDPLTQLPNRRLLSERLHDMLATGVCQTRRAAVLFIDLDNFKELNDSKGHAVGDLLLIEVARRLTSCVRAADTVARLGGDEFVVLVRDLSSDPAQAAHQAEGIGESIRRELNRPFDLAGHQHHSTPSIGINVFAGADQDVDELLKRADIAMYQAKRSGRNALRFFDPEMYAALEDRIALDADLRRALAQQELSLRLQPQVDERGRVFGAEALLRWRHPQRGWVPPAQFIPLAEESDLILEIGHWVLQQAAKLLHDWSGKPLQRGLELSINVSARQFRKPDFAEVVTSVIGSMGIGPGQLKLELTESLVLQNMEDSVDKMNALRRQGIKFALDDFGTGQSSLAYLTRLPLDQLKIDQSFVRHMTRSHSDAVVVQTIIGMANSLGIEIIAEGVETEEQRRLLELHGCRRHQGYLFGQPMPPDEFELLLQHAALSGAG